ncbi:MAG: AAA family ATPase [Coriobacteriales bacterium]|nr:AAA family ATPase [Coriobacteriales bacterium]
MMIGRREEQRILRDTTAKEEAQFIVVYGRRRVGKTYLIRETFAEGFTFSYTGIAKVTARRQLTEFARALQAQHPQHTVSPLASQNWFAAFDSLRVLIEQSSRGRDLIFIDEMPWMDNHKSDFLPALEHFWNSWASAQKNLSLIVCGSAAAWITKKMFRNKGGLYNRITRQIRLKPFALAECQALLEANGVRMNPYDIIQCFMVFGGIPYYLNQLDGRYGLPQNIDRLCFVEDAPLRYEHDMVFASLFDRPEKYLQVIEAIASKKKGLTREQIKGSVDFADGGNLSRILKELEESGFVRRYGPLGKKKLGALYQLCDPFTTFYLTWMQRPATGSDNLWTSLMGSGAYHAWSGYAFEQVCLSHITQIKQALGIAGVRADIASWHSSNPGEAGAQIDLVIDRFDNVINLCEIKFSSREYLIDKAYDLVLRNKIGVFQRTTRTRKALHLTMITPYGVKPNTYHSVLQSEITMDDLLRT